MKTLDELKQDWAVDCEIQEDLAAAAIQTPKLHSKYLDQLIEAKLRLTKIANDIAILKVDKGRYFRGEMTKEELTDRGWVQWQYRTLKSDIDGLIEGDADYIKLSTRESYMKVVVSFLESVLGEIKNRNWSIRAAIDYIKFRAGA
jgi:hypothetical protein